MILILRSENLPTKSIDVNLWLQTIEIDLQGYPNQNLGFNLMMVCNHTLGKLRHPVLYETKIKIKLSLISCVRYVYLIY